MDASILKPNKTNKQTNKQRCELAIPRPHRADNHIDAIQTLVTEAATTIVCIVTCDATKKHIEATEVERVVT